MIRRSVRMSLAAAMLATLILFPLPARSGTTTQGVRPDVWIKLCGSKVGCTGPRNPPTAKIPWKGNNVHNTTGWHQTQSAWWDEGTWIFFWITLQNDGPVGGTLRLKGCVGHGRFMVQQYALGLHNKMEYYKPLVITSAVKNGTWQHYFPANGARKVQITLAIQEKQIRGVGIVFTCPVTLRSGDGTVKDTVVATMTTY